MDVKVPSSKRMPASNFDLSPAYKLVFADLINNSCGTIRELEKPTLLTTDDPVCRLMP
jgi:hypothetical protein